jgi:hypothetical protein
MKKFYNTPCSIYRKGTNVTRWSKVQSLSSVYEDIKCAIWSKTSSYWQTLQAVQTDNNSYNMNVDSIYSDILIWDIVVINWLNYKVSNNPVPHERANWIIDNYEIFITLTTW